jgi:hypothetical protein
VAAVGLDHPNTLTSRNNLAYNYRAAGDLGTAIPLSVIKTVAANHHLWIAATARA